MLLTTKSIKIMKFFKVQTQTLTMQLLELIFLEIIGKLFNISDPKTLLNFLKPNL